MRLPIKPAAPVTTELKIERPQSASQVYNLRVLAPSFLQSSTTHALSIPIRRRYCKRRTQRGYGLCA